MLNAIKHEIFTKGTYYKLFIIFIILLITFIVNKIFKKITRRYFESSHKLIKIDITSYLLLRRIISAIIFLTGVSLSVYIIPELKALAISIFAGAGVLAIMIGFAAQNAFSNLISGIFIAIFKPFRVGDIIKFSDKIGVVEDITLRHTVIKNFESKRFVVPNTKISDEVIENFNLHDEKTCNFIEIGISYDSDINLAMQIMRDEILKHPFFHDARTKKEINEGVEQVKVKLVKLGAYSIDLRAWAWAKNPVDAIYMGWDLNKSIKEEFDRQGIEIPFPYRTIVMKENLEKQKIKKNKKNQNNKKRTRP